MPARAAKTKTQFVCQSCGHVEARWVGRCSSCEAWNSFVEEAQTAGPRGADTGPVQAAPFALASVDSAEAERRTATGVGELDRVLGGGLVSGGVILLGGDPGIGKSTIALQMLSGITAAGAHALYVCGEESPAQVRRRAVRLGVDAEGIHVLAAADTDSIRKAIKDLNPAVAVIDSVQTVYSRAVASAPGSVSQVREAGAELVTAAREHDVTLVLIGHVTKEGFLAGPRVLEHLVDTVLYFEGDQNHAYRVLRAIKNRFGPANEIGVFEMLADGLAEVSNPSEVFVAGRREAVAGSAVTCAMEGSRPVMVEIQALVTPGSPGSARRTTLGVDHGRVAMLAAVMEKRLGLSMISHDIFVNTAGGVKISDPGTDLAVMAALASSYRDRALPPSTALLGEIGLTGEVRAVSQVRARAKECARLGFTRIVLPRGSLEQAPKTKGVDLAAVDSVSEAWDLLSAG